jgi:restriction system protein
MSKLTTNIPQYHSFFNPILAALKELGGSASLHELDDKVVEMMNFSDDALKVIHDTATGNETEIEYRLAWARTYLKIYGLINNSSRGVWALTEKADQVKKVDPEQVVRHVREQARASGKTATGKSEPLDEEKTEDPFWKAELYRILTKELAPSAFERLVQRLLRESGFVEVEVSGKTGDGGIDGKGIARIHGLMSFHVIFQCKRYQRVVGAGEIRDFRGAMVGRSDKGLFIATGSFTKDAKKEATRDGAPPIDLLDGDALADKLKELRLGIKTEIVEAVSIDSKFFEVI